MSKYPQVLKYFMWEWQVFFRIGCKTLAESVFNELDKSLRPNVFLIGFNQVNGSEFLPICVEPENLHYPIAEFSNVHSLAREIAHRHEDKNMLYSDPETEAAMGRRFENETFRLALEEILNKSKHSEGNICFASYPARVGDFQVFIVLELNRSIYESYLYLGQKKSPHQESRIFRSFLEATIIEYLNEKRRNIQMPAAGRNLSSGSRSGEEISRLGSRLFFYSISIKGENFYGLHRFYDVCNTLSQYKYENAENFGHIVVAAKKHPDIEMTLELNEPFEITEYRKTRKMLELSNEKVAVITDSFLVLGLGKIKASYNPAIESVFSIRFMGVHCWDIFHASNCLLQMRYGIPRFPKQIINRQKFFLDAGRLFPGITHSQVTHLYHLSVITTKQKKGAMLVISNKAGDEARRFGKRCISIKPIALYEELLLNLTSIDGGVLIDLEGNAHAKGVILDGIVGNDGDAGRGSRYNSAVTYCENKKGAQSTMIVVVSSDGMVDIIPHLIPQIKHSEIVMLIDFLESLNSKETFNRSGFYEGMELLMSREFYLTKEECNKINNLKGDLQKLDERFDDSLRRAFEDLQPNEKMDESYYIKED